MSTPQDKKKKTQDYIKRIYEDPENGYPGEARLYELVKDEGISRKQVKEFLETRKTAQRFKKQKKIPFIPIEAPDDSYQVDLAFYTQYEKKNDGYHVLLCIIEITSRKAFVIPLMNKARSEILHGMKLFFDKDNRKPVRIYTDPGSEWKSRELKKLLDEKQCMHVMYQSAEHNNLGIVDRFIRTLRERIEKHFVSTDKNRWIDALPSIVAGYNRTPHSSLHGLSPNEVHDDDNARQLIHEERAIITQEREDQVLDLKPGALVRISHQKNLFEKGSRAKFSDDVYRVKRSVGYQYQIEDEDGNVLNRRYPRRAILPISEATDRTRSRGEEQAILEKNKQARALKKSGVVNTTKEAKRLADIIPAPRVKREARAAVVDEKVPEDTRGATGRRYQGREKVNYKKPSYKETIEKLTRKR
jgi:hypothetical protein